MSTKLIPILFSTPMVQSILKGQKTMTRRIKGLEKINENPNDWVLTPTKKKICRLYSGVNPNPIKTFFIFENIHTKEQIEIASPYGETRDEASMCDVLWVRESATYVMREHAPTLLEGAKERTQWVYKASVHEDWMVYAKQEFGYKWKPSIHMPFAACRIFLRITDIRIERLKDITDQDAIAEGIQFYHQEVGMPRYRDYMADASGYGDPIHDYPTVGVPACSFSTLWESINGEDSWNANPWVWVISFERCEKPTA